MTFSWLFSEDDIFPQVRPLPMLRSDQCMLFVVHNVELNNLHNHVTFNSEIFIWNGLINFAVEGSGPGTVIMVGGNLQENNHAVRETFTWSF